MKAVIKVTLEFALPVPGWKGDDSSGDSAGNKNLYNEETTKSI
jgi:hypothetical protein